MAVSHRRYRNGRTHFEDPPRQASWRRNLAAGLGYVLAAREMAGDYLSLQAKRLRNRSRRTLRTVEKRVLMLVVVSTVAATAIVLALRGITGGLTEVLGGRAWAAELITAAGLVLIGLAAWAVTHATHPAKPSREPDDDDDWL